MNASLTHRAPRTTHPTIYPVYSDYDVNRVIELTDSEPVAVGPCIYPDLATGNRRMRIGLDARTIYTAQRRGTGKNLVDLYRTLAAVRPDWHVIAYHRGQDEPVLPATVTPRAIDMPGDRFDAWQQVRLPAQAWRDRVDVLHCPANLSPSWMSVPTVVTIHDLIPLDMPAGLPAAEVKRFETAVRTACRRAAWIICPSAYTRDRLVSEFDADADRMTVNAWAPDASVRRLSEQDCEYVRFKYDVFDRFVLHFGANPHGGGARKNTRRVIEAWSMLRRHHRADWKLLIVGLNDAAIEEFRRTAQRLNVTSSVHLAGFAEEIDLPALLSAAEALAYPSLSEGFGLPILDAWATDTPVLTSNTTSLPEVAQDAAHLVEPTDACAIANGLRKVMGDRLYRDELVSRGRARLRNYAWGATAQRFAAAIESAAALRGNARTIRKAA